MMNNFNLFLEIHGCYFSVVDKIIKEAKKGMSQKEIEELVNSQAFYDSAFHMMPKLFSSEWNFLEKRSDNKLYTKDSLANVIRPLTKLEKSWLKSLLQDKRISIFLEKEECCKLDAILCDVPALFTQQDFHIFDSAKDGDPYYDEQYINNFKTIIKACKTKFILKIEYESVKQNTLIKNVLPYKIVYSNRDDKFRLIGVMVQRNNRFQGITLNIARIRSIEITDLQLPHGFDIVKHLNNKVHSEPIVLSISTKRSALERCMLQFASWEKETTYDKENNNYICKIYYDKQDETELLIRILSFGPVIKVLGHNDFLNQMKERIFKQYTLNGK